MPRDHLEQSFYGKSVLCLGNQHVVQEEPTVMYALYYASMYRGGLLLLLLILKCLKA